MSAQQAQQVQLPAPAKAQVQPVVPFIQEIRDSNDLFSDPENIDEQMRQYIMEPGKSDEGLQMEALIRDFLMGRPYSKRIFESMQQGWSIPYVCRHVDNYGLYNLIEPAQEFAVKLSTEPLSELGIDGVSGLRQAADYYKNTGRASTANRIFINLNTSGGTNPDHHEEPPPNTDQREPLLFSTEWKSAQEPHDLIKKHDNVGAGKSLDLILKSEQSKASHGQANISRLIHLAKAYAAEGQNSDAQKLLEALLPLTENTELLNAHLYICAELYFLTSGKTKDSNQYLLQLIQTAKKINDLLATYRGPANVAAAGSEESVLKMLDHLALAYSFNGEPQKATKLLTPVLAYFPSINSI